MTVYIALLRAVNVGGTGKLPMADLVRIAESVGFRRVKTYLASGNLIFESAESEEEVKTKLADQLSEYAGKHVTVFVRTAAELASVLSANPFPDRAPNRTGVIFLDDPPPADLEVVAPAGEEVQAGTREVFVHYPQGMGRSKLKMSIGKKGTARNINTVTRLVAMTSPTPPSTSVGGSQ